MAVDAVGDAFEEETVFTVYVRNTFAIEDHKVDLNIKKYQGMGCISNPSPCE